MKKFSSSDLGGAPITKEDLRIIFNLEIWDAIQALLFPFNADTEGIIVSGCILTANGGGFDMTSGIVYINGGFKRISSVTAQAFTKYIIASADIADARVFSDGITHTVAFTSGAEIAAAPGSGQSITINSLTGADDRRWSNIITNKQAVTVTFAGQIIPLGGIDIGSWINLSYLNSWAISGSRAIGYIKDRFGFVHLRGLANAGASSSATIATLPSGFRPLTGAGFDDYTYLMATQFGGSANDFVKISIDATSGNIRVSTNYDVTNDISFDGISFYAGI